jgi:hypothetical protein
VNIPILPSPRLIHRIDVRLRAAIACFCLLAPAGCGVGSSEAGDDHAGHVIPAHKPKNLPEAVRRLRTLNEQIGRMIAEGKAKALGDDKALTFALDIANWLPEIAADSDMPEAPWNRVNAESGRLAAHYQQIQQARGDNASSVKGADHSIAALEALLTQPQLADGTKSARPGGFFGMDLKEPSSVHP